MTVLERKARHIKTKLNDTDEKRFIELEKTSQHLAKREPCVYTVEELNQRAERVEQDYLSGKGTFHEEMRKRHAV
jgi:hypothetical protein